jgi:hypothetical protein
MRANNDAPKCACPCCGTSIKNNNGHPGQAATIRAGSGNPVDWRDSLRPFLGLYVFKG